MYSTDSHQQQQPHHPQSMPVDTASTSVINDTAPVVVPQFNAIAAQKSYRGSNGSTISGQSGSSMRRSTVSAMANGEALDMLCDMAVLRSSSPSVDSGTSESPKLGGVNQRRNNSIKRRLP